MSIICTRTATLLANFVKNSDVTLGYRGECVGSVASLLNMTKCIAV